jgi:opacity protein-like surface antigen
MRPALAAILLLLVLPAADPVAAQDGFLFRPPTFSLTVRATHGALRADGDVYDFMTDELTLERGDFAGQGFGIEAAIAAHERFALVLGVSRVQSVQRSEFREFIGEDDLPIEQTTKLLRVPATVGLRLYPLGRGRALSAHAWVPARITPYLQGGAGLQWYRLTQEGDFVDYETLNIFPDELRSSGSSVTAQVGGGADYWVTPRIALNADVRYGWGSADLDATFPGFSEIDLSGYQASIGLSFRF